MLLGSEKGKGIYLGGGGGALWCLVDNMVSLKQ